MLKPDELMDKAAAAYQKEGFGFWGFAVKSTSDGATEEFIVLGNKSVVDQSVIVENTILAHSCISREPQPSRNSLTALLASHPKSITHKGEANGGTE
jgi:hypothetical protein